MPTHEIFGENLACLNSGGHATWTENTQAGLAEGVSNPVGERSFRAYDSEVNGLIPRERQEVLNVAGLDRNTLGERGNPRISRSAEDIGDARALGDLPDKSVFSAASANDENPHGMIYFGLGMAEMPNTGQNHGHTMLIYGLNHFVITDRSAWLNHGSNSSICRFVDAVTKWEECIGCHDSAFEWP
jgi:hypothetical protein